MPTYNKARFIAEALSSVLDQTYPHWELLIVDDASTDHTGSVLAPFREQDPRVRFFQLERNRGAAVARNHALQQAAGRYWAFLDSDDLWHPEKLERQLAFMEEQNAAFSFTAYQLLDAAGEKRGKTILVPPHINYERYLKDTIIGCLTVVLDREKIGEVRFPDLRRRQDMALWLSILKNGWMAQGLDCVLAYYRRDADSISANKFKAARDVWKVYREVEKLPWLFSARNFAGYAWRALKKWI